MPTWTEEEELDRETSGVFIECCVSAVHGKMRDSVRDLAVRRSIRKNLNKAVGVRRV